MPEQNVTSWLLLIHQVPGSPPYLRVKVWRRLQRIGAVAVKSSVYALPRSDDSAEDFHWVAREIIEAHLAYKTFPKTRRRSLALLLTR